MQYNTPVRDDRLGTNPRISFMNIPIDALTMDQTVELVDRYLQTGTGLHLVGINADKVNQLREDGYMRQVVEGCGVINADGSSVIMACRLLGTPLPERVAGIDLMEQLVALSAQKGYRVYLLGAEQPVVEQTAGQLCGKYPGLQLAGYRNGYFSREEWAAVSETLKKAAPQLVFVGISSPMKEELICYLRGQGHNCVFMGVGGSFDVIANKRRRAPVWMQKLGMEWLFRCVQEPRRLFARYFVGNFRFIRAVLGELLRQKRNRQ